METRLIRWMWTLLFLGAALLGSAQTAQAQAHQCMTGTADGRRTCNCSRLEVQVQVCHVSSASVTLGSRDIGSFTTGQSSSTCYTVKLPTEKCVWIRYHYTCCPTLFSWKCFATSNSVHSSAASSGDC